MGKRNIPEDAIYQPLRAAARITGLSYYSIRKGVLAGTIPAIRIGNEFRVNMPAFLKQLEAKSGI